MILFLPILHYHLVAPKTLSQAQPAASPNLTVQSSPKTISRSKSMFLLYLREGCPAPFSTITFNPVFQLRRVHSNRPHRSSRLSIDISYSRSMGLAVKCPGLLSLLLTKNASLTSLDFRMYHKIYIRWFPNPHCSFLFPPPPIYDDLTTPPLSLTHPSIYSDLHP